MNKLIDPKNPHTVGKSFANLGNHVLIAGFIGYIAQIIILNIVKFPKLFSNKTPFFLLITFTVSALFGFIMKFSKLFPHLDNTYYLNLGHIRGMKNDGISGLIVQITMLILIHIYGLYISKN